MKRILIFLIVLSIIVVSSGCDMIRIVNNGPEEGELEDGQVLATFSDNTSTTTRPVTLPNSWELQWEYEGEGNFIIWVHDDGDYPDLAANHIGSGSGAHYEPQGGEYYFDVTASDTWQIIIVNVE